MPSDGARSLMMKRCAKCVRWAGRRSAKSSEEAAAIGMTIDEIVQTGAKRRGPPAKDREEA